MKEIKDSLIVNPTAKATTVDSDKKKRRSKQEVLADKFKKDLGLPLASSAVSNENYDYLNSEFNRLYDLQESVNKIKEKGTRRKAYRSVMDQKLEFFYRYCIYAETSQEVYKMFRRQLWWKGKGNMRIRKHTPSSWKVKSRYSSLVEWKDELSFKPFGEILEEFDSIYNESTCFLLIFTDTEKKSNQTKRLLKVAKKAGKEYGRLIKKCQKAVFVLDYARTCAYRNVYLGVELINLIRMSTGGGSLAKAKDETKIEKVSKDLPTVKTSDLRVNVSDKDIHSTLNSVLNDIGNVANMFSSIEMKKWSSENVNATMGIVGIAAIGSVVANFGGMVYNYFQKVNANDCAQFKMTQYMSDLSEKYRGSLGALLRSIELIEAIYKANQGFMSVYLPLQKSLLSQRDYQINILDLKRLAAATNAFKKISDSKI